MKISNQRNAVLLSLLAVYSAMIFMFNGEENKVKYVYAAYTLLVLYLLLYTFQGKRGLLEFSTPCKFMLAYLIFGAASMIWSPMRSETLNRLIAFTLLFGLCVLINNYHDKEAISSYMITAIIIGGFCEAVYCIYYYGFNTFISFITSGVRFNDYTINNVNTLSNTLVIAVVTTVAVILFERKYWLLCLLLPEVFSLLAFSSRTAFIALIVSVIIILVKYRQLNRAKRYPEYYFVCFIIAAALIFVAFRISTGEAAILSRFDTLFSFLRGNGEGAANSLSSRSDYIKLGFQEFFEYPVGGRGFGCAGYILQTVYGRSTYLHNNYVEILASGGIIGFVLYYGCYFYLLKRHIQIIRRSVSLITLISFATLCCEMITQIGIVTYYSKVTWLVMALWFVAANNFGCLYTPAGDRRLRNHG